MQISTIDFFDVSYLSQNREEINIYARINYDNQSYQYDLQGYLASYPDMITPKGNAESESTSLSSSVILNSWTSEIF